MNAMFKSTGASNPVEGLFHIFQILVNEVLKDFVIFFHGVLQAMTEAIPAKAKPYGMVVRDANYFCLDRSEGGV
ncbi:MAG: hypothetical protein WBN75_21515 [Verrucomicrobiia bacterium]|jgi:hypothetical protein